MFPVIGSGRFITAPVITENGQPNYDPLVLQEINLGKILLFPNIELYKNMYSNRHLKYSCGSLRYKLKWFRFL